MDSAASWVSAGIGVRCFVADTLFPVWADGGWRHSPGHMLTCGAQVLAADNETILTIVNLKHEQASDVLSLRARGAVLSVTRNHRMLVPQREGPGVREVKAATLKEGDHIICSAGVAKLEAVDLVPGSFGVLAITFRPDLPVAAFLKPEALITKGCAHSRRGRAPVVRHKVAEQQNDVASWPDTASNYGFDGYA